ncbi:MAG: class C sortase [Clostridia bacterium]|nr:class C sortase [Clostridia bacterium]
MFRKISTIIMLSLFFIGLSVLLYPAISSYWNTKTQSYAVENYENMLENLGDIDYDELFRAASDYNTALTELPSQFSDYPSLDKEYQAALNLGNDGMMGYISIDNIGVTIPIYHGTSETVLSKAAGHVEGTSLPIGGESTHSVISAHRGLPNAKMFTDLDKLQLGDTFKITVYDRVMVYQVDSILVVTPENATNIVVENGKDFCTLLTCTPYGINSHRLLVRGSRIDELTEKTAHIGAEAFRIDALIVTPIVALPILLVLIIYVSLQPVKRENLIEGDDINA